MINVCCGGAPIRMPTESGAKTAQAAGNINTRR
jgi:hypothetical protein